MFTDHEPSITSLNSSHLVKMMKMAPLVPHVSPCGLRLFVNLPPPFHRCKLLVRCEISQAFSFFITLQSLLRSFNFVNTNSPIFQLSTFPNMPSPKGTLLLTGANGGTTTSFVFQLLKSPSVKLYKGYYTVRDPGTALTLASILEIPRF
jgi:hypothetical protein